MVELTEKIRNDPESNKLVGWIAEMHGYALAAADLGIKHSMREDLMDRPPYEIIADPYTLHYDIRHDAPDFSWDKREYMHDILADAKTVMKLPTKSPNPRFTDVFVSINKALEDYRGTAVR